MKLKFIQAAVAGLMLSVCNMANAGLITETWSAEITQSFNNDFQVGDLLSWSVVYEKDSLSANVYGDGADELANTVDDVLWSFYHDDMPELYNLSSSTQVSMFDAIFSQLKNGAINSLLPTDIITDEDHNRHNYSVLSSYKPNSPERRLNKRRDAYELFSYENGSGQGQGEAFYAYKVNAQTQHQLSSIRFNITSVSTEAPQSVPEPSTLAIFALGIMGLASRRFKKQ